jgi:hypothetical protein
VQSVPIAWHDSHLETPQACVYLEVNLIRLNERPFKAQKVLQFFLIWYC